MSRLFLAPLLLCACGGAPALQNEQSMSYDSHGESRVLSPFVFDSCERAADRGSAVWRCIQKGDTVEHPQVQLELVFRESFFTPNNLYYRSFPFDFSVHFISILPVAEGRGIVAFGGFEGELNLVPWPDGTAVLTGELTEVGGGRLAVAFNTRLTLPPPP